MKFSSSAKMCSDSTEKVSEGKVVHNTLTSEFFQASKQQSDDMQPHYKHAYANNEALKTSTADYAKNVTQGSLGTKAQAKPDVTVRLLGTSEVHKEEKKIKPKNKIDLECREKCETTGISRFKNPMRCTGAVVNAVANTISNSDSTEIVQSAPDPSAGHSSTSAGCGTETETSVPDPSCHSLILPPNVELKQKPPFQIPRCHSLVLPPDMSQTPNMVRLQAFLRQCPVPPPDVYPNALT